MLTWTSLISHFGSAKGITHSLVATFSLYKNNSPLTVHPKVKSTPIPVNTCIITVSYKGNNERKEGGIKNKMEDSLQVESIQSIP